MIISFGAWGSVVVKVLRYLSDGPGMDSRWCHWGFAPSSFRLLLVFIGAWGGVVVKALRYQSDGPGIDSRWCHWIFQ